MGLIHVDIGLSNPSEQQDSSRATERIRALVDTGATLSVAPAALLESLGVQRIGQRRLRGFGGTLIRDVGTVNLAYDGEVAGITVAFGEEGEPAVLGVTALETLGFQVDPVAGKLSRVDMLI